jgi:hypothetical protein
MDSPRPSHVISESARIPASADHLYSIIADYRNGHPRILPKQFSGLIVDEGGVGAGTVIRFEMRSFGRMQKFHGVVSEPQPGRILAETYLDGTVTTFTLTPGASEVDTEVAIKTEMPARRGLAGALEGYFAARYLRPIFVEELKLLAAVALDHEKPGR